MKTQDVEKIEVRAALPASVLLMEESIANAVGTTIGVRLRALALSKAKSMKRKMNKQPKKSA